MNLEELKNLGYIPNNTLVNADCLDVFSYIEDKSIDCIITDLPYGTTACSWDTIIPFESLWFNLKRIRKDGCPVVLFANEPFASYLRISNIKEFKYDWVWKKSKSGSAFTAKYRPVNKHEMICVFGKGTINYYPQCTEGEPYKRVHKKHNVNNHEIGFNGSDFEYSNDGFRYPITIQEFQQKWRRQDQVHPTQKPLELMEYLVKTYSQENDLVLDFTMGSGTTPLACKRLNRRYIGIEKEEEYYDIAAKRLLENLDILKKETKNQKENYRKKLV